jgi:hypothetical protein
VHYQGHKRKKYTKLGDELSQLDYVPYVGVSSSDSDSSSSSESDEDSDFEIQCKCHNRLMIQGRLVDKDRAEEKTEE